MGNSTQRPRPGAAPELTGDIKMLRRLLEIENRRLDTAVLLEEERKIVFPETTVIIRDIQKIMAAILQLENPARTEMGGLADLLSDF